MIVMVVMTLVGSAFCPRGLSGTHRLGYTLRVEQTHALVATVVFQVWLAHDLPQQRAMLRYAMLKQARLTSELC